MKLNENYKNIIIAHRGIHDNIIIPENSLSSFELAIKKGYPIELDIQLTKDNIPVVFHDTNTYRMTGYNKKIKNLTLEEVKTLLLLNAKEKIPTFKETLELIDGQVLLDIELKPTKRIEKLISITLKLLKDYSGSVILKSFSKRIVRKLKNKSLPFPCGLLISGNRENKIKYFFNTSSLPLIYCKPDFLAISKKLILNKKFINYKKRHPVFIFTINSKEELLKYKNMKVGFICNNLPYKKDSYNKN